MAEIRTVTILHTKSDKEWCQYLVDNFESDNRGLKIDVIDVTALSDGDQSEKKTALGDSNAVILLVSCFFLELLEDENLWLGPALQKRNKSDKTVIAATLGVQSKSLQEVAEKCNYDNERWTVIDIDVSGQKISEFISQVQQIVAENARVTGPALPTKKTSACDLSSVTSSMSAVEMIPRKVDEAGEKVAIIFAEKKERGSVIVHTEGGETLPLEIMNPHCVVFQAPEIIGSKVTIQVDVNNTRFRKFKLHRRSTAEFTSVKFMCQSYGLSSKDELDKFLADKITASMCSDGHAMAILADLTETVAKGRKNSVYPTLLHWAAGNGLNELCSALLTAPGSREACDMLNSDGDDVSDLAEKNGYQDLSDFISDFMETKQAAFVCDLYVQSIEAAAEQTELNDDRYEYVLDEDLDLPKTSGRLSLPPRVRLPLDNDDNYIKPDSLLVSGATGGRNKPQLMHIQEAMKKVDLSFREAKTISGLLNAQYEPGNTTKFKDRQDPIGLQIKPGHSPFNSRVSGASLSKSYSGTERGYGQTSNSSDEAEEDMPVLPEQRMPRSKTVPSRRYQGKLGDSQSTDELLLHSSQEQLYLFNPARQPPPLPPPLLPPRLKLDHHSDETAQLLRAQHLPSPCGQPRKSWKSS